VVLCQRVWIVFLVEPEQTDLEVHIGYSELVIASFCNLQLLIHCLFGRNKVGLATISASELRQTDPHAARIVRLLKKLQRLLDHFHALIDARSFDVQTSQIRQATCFTQTTLVGPRKLDRLVEIKLRLRIVALARKRVAEFEQASGSEVFELLLLCEVDRLRRIILGFRKQTTLRMQIAEIDQRSDLLRFVADRSRGLERLLKLVLRLVKLALIAQQNAALAEHLDRALLVTRRAIQSLCFGIHLRCFVRLLFAVVDVAGAKIGGRILMPIQFDGLKVVFERFISVVVILVSIPEIYVDRSVVW